MELIRMSELYNRHKNDRRCAEIDMNTDNKYIRAFLKVINNDVLLYEDNENSVRTMVHRFLDFSAGFTYGMEYTYRTGDVV